MSLIDEARKHLSSAPTDAEGILWYESDILLERILTAYKESCANKYRKGDV
ncbi:MAG: hypothetical protein KAR06_03890 [Deltaproteobacteria bacterium]|nr:hypothetical protein [Deltaproteobacteria bacterium]